MSRRYNVAGQLVQQVEKDSPGELISQFDFSYDAAGNILKEQKLPKSESVSLSPVTMTYSAANRLATYNGQAVQFDAEGNLLVGPLAGEMANFSFDSRNRLVSAGETSYRYDAENQRIGVNQTSYVVNSQPALSQVLVKEESGVKTFYVYGLGLLGNEKEGEYRSYHFDFRGSTVALSDKMGKVVQRFQYGPYGELLKGEASQTPFLFNGKYGVMTDSHGLYYMRARFYSAVIKRFVNQDLLKGFVASGQSLNRFMFVQGDPVKYTDPFGLDRSCGPGYRAVADPTQPHVSFCVRDGSDPNAKICVTEECLWRGTNDNSYEGPRIFGGIGGYASVHMVGAGLSATAYYITDLGKQCLFATTCGRLGPGVYIGGGLNFPYGLASSDIENSLSGCSVGMGGDLAFGESIGITGNVGLNEEGTTSIGTAKGSGHYGKGIGLSMGVDACYTWVLFCSKR